MNRLSTHSLKRTWGMMLPLFSLPFLSEEGAEDSLPVHEPCCSTQVRKTTKVGWMCQSVFMLDTDLSHNTTNPVLKICHQLSVAYSFSSVWSTQITSDLQRLLPAAALSNSLSHQYWSQSSFSLDVSVSTLIVLFRLKKLNGGHRQCNSTQKEKIPSAK